MKLFATAVAVVLLACGCAADSYYVPTLDDRVLVDFFVIGGFAGVQDELVIHRDGELVLTEWAGPQRTSRLKRSDLTRLNRNLSRLARPLPYYGPSTVKDGFRYDLNYRKARVVMEDFAKAPDELVTVMAQLGRIYERLRYPNYP